MDTFKKTIIVIDIRPVEAIYKYFKSPLDNCTSCGFDLMDVMTAVCRIAPLTLHGNDVELALYQMLDDNMESSDELSPMVEAQTLINEVYEELRKTLLSISTKHPEREVTLREVIGYSAYFEIH